MFETMPMFSQFNQQFQQQMQPNNQFTIRQVGSENEAKNSMISPLYIHIFINYNNGEIYVKKMGNNGLSEFITYHPITQNQKDPFEIINQRLTNIESKLEGVTNVQSVSNVYTSDAKSNDAENEKSESSTIQQSTGNDSRKK